MMRREQGKCTIRTSLLTARYLTCGFGRARTRIGWFEASSPIH